MLVSDLPISLWGLEKLVQGAGPEIELAGTAVDCGEATRIIYETPNNATSTPGDTSIRPRLPA